VQDLTQDTIARNLLRTAGFMLVTMVFQTLYILVDLYFVGRLGKEAVAGVAVAGNLQFVVLAATQVLGVGTTTLVAHAVGRKDHDRALLAFNQSQTLSMLVGLAFVTVSMALRTRYATLQSADPATAQAAADYLFWFLPALALQFGIVAMASALRGAGNFRPGMVVQTATVIINIVLAPVLIFGWGTGRPLGVAGAALATFIAVLVGVTWLAVLFVPRTAYLRFEPARLAPQLGMWSALLKVGLPAGAEFALTAVNLFVVYAITRPFGAEAQAGYGIGMRVLQASFMPVVALAFAASPIAGQNFGAGLGERVRAVFRLAAAMAAGLMAVTALIAFFGAAPLIGIFSPDPRVIEVGRDYLRIVAVSFVPSGIVFVASSMFQAMGNTMPALLASLSRLLVFAMPAFLLSKVEGFHLHWIWYLSVAAILLQLAAILWLLEREFRTRLDRTGAPGAAAPVVVAPIDVG
jgi:putative MATE family efflux protein